MKNGWKKRLALAVFPPLLSVVLRLLFLSYRLREHGKEHVEKMQQEGMPVVCTMWHYSVVTIIHGVGLFPFSLMISSSNDGDILAATLQRFGFSVVRGSTHSRGAAAARELIREMRKGQSAGIIADGSQGPAMVAQAGPLLLAAKTGRVVFPVLLSASSYFAFHSWDRMIIPKPFAKVDVVYGAPIYLPEGLKAHDLEAYRVELERHMTERYHYAWGLHGKEGH